MAFIDARLNKRYGYGFQGGPQWNTISNPLRSGRERRMKAWSMPKYRFTANYATFSDAEKEELLGAFMAAAGSFASFRFRDWNDFKAIDQIIGVGDGTSTPMQLVRNYFFGSAVMTRPITLPLNPVVLDDDDQVIDVTVDPLTGIATPATNWPNGKVLRWNGKFDTRVHFASDFNPFTSQSPDIRTCTVELEEVWD